MASGDGIGLGYTSTNSSTSSNTNTSGNSTETTSAGNATTKNSLNDYINSLMGQTSTAGSEYTKENAIADAQGQVENIFNSFKNNFLPTVYQAGNATGGYNSTAQQLMANNGYAQATTQAAGAVLANINAYGQLAQTSKQNTATDLLTALGLGQKGDTTVSSNFATNTFGHSSTDATGLSVNASNGGSGGLLGMLSGLF